MLADQNAMLDILRSGGVPLIASLSESQIEFVDSRSDPAVPYVAISHVWSDGLGKAGSNSLRYCQLSRLRHYAEVLLKDQHLTTSPYFWIDKICCPVGPSEDKTLAMRKMRGTYEQAESTLVIHSDLLNQSMPECSALEILFRIFTSSWMRRLWTLQEGALAGHLKAALAGGV